MENPTIHHEYGYIQDDKVFLKGYLNFPDRQIGVVKESPEASIKYFERRFEIAQNKVNELERLISEAQNKGSYLMKLIHMRKYLSEFDGLGDFVALFDKLDKLEALLRNLIAANRIKNLEIKRALLSEITAIIQAPEFKDVTNEVRELKMKWIKTGSAPAEYEEELERSFNEGIKKFFELKKQFYKARAKAIKENLRNYRLIIEKAEQLKDSDDFEKAFEEFRELQKNWKTAGKIPHKKATKLWERFKNINDYFFQRYKNYKPYKEKYAELDALGIRNTEQKRLCYEAEKLVNSDKEGTAEIAKTLLMDWKKLSNTFKCLDEDIYNRFRNACDKIFEYNYLLRVVKRKYPNIELKPREDKLRIKTSFMRELIRRDEREYQLAETNIQKTLASAKTNASGNPNNKKKAKIEKEKMMQIRNMQNNLQVQKRKIQVKKTILADLEAELRSLKSGLRNKNVR
ncbi:MAG: DUF349 domain-containing protein [Microscillaceae bacterium]|nr:DUF349 domain-containing protein [Microscillaceae bacterium]MDW8461333.1 DUF349 domain-containing protein [Cytophagales bacterium]